MDRRAFAGLMIIETMLAFGNTFAGSFNIIYLFNQLSMELWTGTIYLGIGFTISVFVSLWMSWTPRLDPRNVMLAGLVFLIIEYSLFLTVKDGWILSLAVGAAFGLFYPCFWTPFNIIMAQMTKKTDRGITYGAFFFVWPMVTFFAPFLGGIVIGLFNYQLLFMLGITIVAATAVVIVAYRKYIPKDQAMKIRFEAIGRRNVVALVGEGGFEGVFWLSVTLVAWWYTQDELELGGLFSLFGLSAGIMGIILGRASDRIQNRRFFVKLSAITSIPCIVLIALTNDLDGYLIGNGLLEFASFILPVFIFALLTDRLEEHKNDSVITREFLLDIGRAISIGCLMLVLYLGVKPTVAFLIAVPFLVMSVLAQEAVEKH
jgi:MFS family permease